MDMELKQYAAIIWKWSWLIVMSTFLSAATALAVSWIMPPIYQASTTLLVSQASNPAVPVYQDILTSERLARTYQELLQKRPVLDKVISDLNLEVMPSELAEQMDVQLVRDTQLIELKVEDADPYLAMRLANKIPEIFVEQNEQMQLARFAASKDSLQAQLTTLESDIQTTQQAIDALRNSKDADAMELSRLEANLSQLRTSYSGLLQSYEEIRLAEAQSLDNVVVVEPAEWPEKPVRPRKLMNTLLAAALGCMLAVGGAFLIDYLDDTIKSPDDVVQALGLSPLGAISRIDGKGYEDRLIAAIQPRSHVSEAYRILRTNIQFSAVDRPLETLLVSSPNPIEGKSITVANLGVVVAQAGLSAILVDSDLRRPVLHKIFDLPNKEGLTTVLLEGEPNLDGRLQATQVENLRVLTSGPLPPNPSELLGSQKMKSLIESLKGKA
ncbi:MAG: polysaccharide biosynthesis tyrosine autokinase, partial [Anaerolineae bacterium]